MALLPLRAGLTALTGPVLLTGQIGLACLPGLGGLLLLTRVGRLLLARHLTRELLRLLPELGLIARELFELPLQLLFGHSIPLPRKLLLLLEQLVLPARQVLDLVERLAIRILSLLARGRRLVIGLLRSLQLLVEQRRDVVIPVAVPGAALARLLARNLTLLDVGLRLQQRVERLHLGRQRLAGL